MEEIHKMANEELQYLRTELDRLNGSHAKHTHTTITTIIVIWSGVLIFLGAGNNNLMEGVFNNRLHFLEPNNIFSCFIIVTIFFISNLVLSSMAHRSFISSTAIHILGAYIAVFYEKKPSKTNVDGNSCYESVFFEVISRDKSIDPKYVDVYKTLFFISIALMVLFTYFLFLIVDENNEFTIDFFLLLINLVCIFCSVRWCSRLPMSRSLQSNRGMRAKFMKEFIKYRHDMGVGDDAGENFENMLAFKMDSVKAAIRTQKKLERKKCRLTVDITPRILSTCRSMACYVISKKINVIK